MGRFELEVLTKGWVGGAWSRFSHFKKFSLKFLSSPFVIRVNLLLL